MSDLDGLSLSEIVRQTSNDVQTGAGKKAEPIEPVVEPDPEPSPEEAAAEVEAEGLTEFPKLLTPPADSSWSWQQAKAHEDTITRQAFEFLKKVLIGHGMKFKEDDTQPYTLHVGEVIVQNILLPGPDPRVVMFKGIRIIPPTYLSENGKQQRVDSFRRKRAGGPFNFQGLLERIQLRNQQAEATRKAQLQEQKEAKAAAKLQKKELGQLDVPDCLELQRQPDGTYYAKLVCEALSLKGAKSLAVFGRKVDAGEV